MTDHAPLSSQALTEQSSVKRPILLVHGAWLGEWCWEQVADHLRAQGHTIYMVSLTGHGQRRDESGPHITLADHVADVVEVIRSEDLNEILLVGHSYGGRVITQVWGQVAERIAGLVYLDAHAPVEIPETARPAWDVAAPPQMIPFGGVRLDADMVGADLDRIRSLLVDHSAATIAVPWKLPLPADLPKTYIHATGEALAPFSAYAAVVAADPSWTYHEIPGPHLLVFTHPAEVAALLASS
jgi:pimeloyl-ACP methyl ester carboxylesterase